MNLARPGHPWPFMSTASFVKPATMRQMRYVGKTPELIGKTALITPCTDDQDMVLAQFDEFDLTCAGVDLSHGWHSFHVTEFEGVT